MKLDDLDRLIAELAEEAVAGQSDEYARSLMADACAILGHYRLQCRTSEAIIPVLDQAQAICATLIPTAEMIDVLREYGCAMQKAQRECLNAQRESDLLETRPTPEDLAQNLIAEWSEQNGPCRYGLDYFLAQGIRTDRINEWSGE